MCIEPLPARLGIVLSAEDTEVQRPYFSGAVCGGEASVRGSPGNGAGGVLELEEA